MLSDIGLALQHKRGHVLHSGQQIQLQQGTPVSPTDKKRAAAERALALIEPGMVIGLGSGSTAGEFVNLLGAKVRDGFEVTGVPTSRATHSRAVELAIPLTSLDAHPVLDLTVDGADELDDQLRLIKGGGGALLREKIVAAASDGLIIIADDTKHVSTLGRHPLPVEVVEFGLGATRTIIEAVAGDLGLEGDITLRRLSADQAFKTDSGHLILDCAFGAIPEPEVLAEWLDSIPGVVEHGLFIEMADLAIVAGDDGVTLIEAVADRDAPIHT